jgi:hypothetical protein
MLIKQYEFKKVEVASKEVNLPTETSYYFETHIRRSIKIIPVYTTWNNERFGLDEEIYQYRIICLYNSFERKGEVFNINVNEIENIYYSTDDKHKSVIKGLIDGHFQERTKEEFDADLETIIRNLQS